MTRERIALGARGEALVAAHLERAGFTILGRNVRVGRLELDVIARRGSLVVFVEVRTRASSRVVAPVETIDVAKLDRIRRAAAGWLREQKLLGRVDVRIDAASVVLSDAAPALDYYEGDALR